MEYRTLGKVVECWSTPVVVTAEEWVGLAAVPMPLLPPHDEETLLQHYYLRVAVLDPQTEQTRRWIVGHLPEEQWRRYPLGSWLRLRVRGWPPLLRWLRWVTIDEAAETPSADHVAADASTPAIDSSTAP